ncbi:TasA family protein [Cellulomonas alba]|uniref:TasA family protein n=1 Tax=Cellulomonas alba TaxID=3053467 RepID=A0ABT7SG23_9CELL|nr:TasA family protein [Cellulomonas alba]MDM7854492.1 TasA family protein [Cellulomonas alba]
MDDLLQEMIDPTPEPGDRPRRRRLIATIAIVGLAIVGITSLTTGALFTDREQTDDGFKTGTVDLTTGQLKFTTTAGNMLPGDTTYSAIDVKNAGSLNLRYAVEYSASNDPAAAGIDTGVEMSGTTGLPDDAGTGTEIGGDLTDVLHLSVYAVGSQSDCAAPAASDRIYPADTSAAPALTAGSGNPLVGNKSEGQDAKAGAIAADRVLGAGDAEVLCFVTTMDIDAGNKYQDSGAHLTLDFYAEQTANNS